MSKLQNLLALPDVSDIQKEVFINEQLGAFIIKPVTEQQLQTYRLRSRQGKSDTIDASRLNCMVIENHVVDPDLRNADFLAEAKCGTASDFINRKFTAGITARIVNEIMEASDLTDVSEDMEKAKN